jgi:BASS family bile acid:Na+ symporter
MVETVSFVDFLETIGVLAALTFVLSSMLGMGFSLTVREIIEPLKNIRLVILALVANFVLVPLLALVLLLIFPLSEGLFSSPFREAFKSAYLLKQKWSAT